MDVLKKPGILLEAVMGKVCGLAVLLLKGVPTGYIGEMENRKGKGNFHMMWWRKSCPSIV